MPPSSFLDVWFAVEFLKVVGNKICKKDRRAGAHKPPITPRWTGEPRPAGRCPRCLPLTISIQYSLKMMRSLLRLIESNIDPQGRSRQTFWYMVHRFGLQNRKLANRYVLNTQVRKLHLGCGWNLLPGWLNMDYIPLCRRALYLDARRPFFFVSETFDYIFSEHMIEHMSYHDGLNMLVECHRILKPHGKIRISTPDLAFLIALYGTARSSLQREYVEWANSTFLKDAPDDNEVFVINNFMRDWGHTFIYDERTLKSAMISAGFTDVTKFDLQKSGDTELCNLENLTRIPTRFLEMETMIFEGTKKRNRFVTRSDIR